MRRNKLPRRPQKTKWKTETNGADERRLKGRKNISYRWMRLEPLPQQLMNGPPGSHWKRRRRNTYGKNMPRKCIEISQRRHKCQGWFDRKWIRDFWPEKGENLASRLLVDVESLPPGLGCEQNKEENNKGSDTWGYFSHLNESISVADFPT